MIPKKFARDKPGSTLWLDSIYFAATRVSNVERRSFSEFAR